MKYKPIWKITGINKRTKKAIVFPVSGKDYSAKRIKEIFCEVHPEIEITSVSKYDKAKRKKISPR